MKHKKLLYLLLIAVATSFDVLAEEVFKTTDESGSVEFSDKKSPGSEKIEVKPNVVDVDIPVMPESTVGEMPESTVGEKSKQASGEPNEDPQETEGSGSATAGNLKRKIRNTTNAGEKIKQRDKQPVTIQPVPQPVVRPGGRR